MFYKTRKNNYKSSIPIKNVSLVNKLFDNGYFIKIFTADIWEEIMMISKS